MLYNIIIGGYVYMTIREIRKELNMSQSEFAKYLEIPIVNIQHWEQGVSKPPEYVLRLINRLIQYEITKTDKEYKEELSVLDGIKKCVIRYAISVSTENKDELQSEWCQSYLDYLRNKENAIENKIITNKRKG